MALPSELRLKKRSDFEKLKRPTAIFPSDNLILKCSKESNSEWKFGFAVPKRLAKAVLRNRIRRILSEWVRGNVSSFPKGYIWLIVVREIPEDRSSISKTLREEIEELARKASRELEP